MHEQERKNATEADLDALPEGTRAELVGGELWIAPQPTFWHQRIAGAIHAELLNPYDRGRGGPGGWWIAIEPDVRLAPGTIFVPDLAGWRRERMPVLPEGGRTDLIPDWVCEVLSPSTGRRDRKLKADHYLRARVPHYWIVDPVARTVEAFAAQGLQWLRLGAWSDGDLARIAPFDAVEIDVGALFPPPMGVNEPEPAYGP